MKTRRLTRSALLRLTVGALALLAAAAWLLRCERCAVGRTPAPDAGPQRTGVIQPAAGASRREPPPPAAPPPAANEWLFVGDSFEGTFLQLWQAHTTWTQSDWEAEFAQLRRAGMKLVVVQWVQHDECDYTTPGPDRTSVLDRLIAAADTAGTDLCVGLSLRTSWWQADSFRAPYLREELERNRRLADRIAPKLRGHRSFYGWYIPHEITDIDAAGDRGAEVRAFFGELTKHLNTADPLKPILASGYTDRDRAQLVPFVTWWTLFLREAGIDVLVFQDGAGLSRRAPWQAIAPWIDALGTVADETGGDIWLVGETFTQTHGPPIDSDGFQAQSADFTRLRQQLELLGTSKRRLLAYSYFDYMRPAAGAAAAALFEAYIGFVDARAAARHASTGTPSPPSTTGNEP